MFHHSLDFTNSNVSSTNSIDVPSDQPSLLPSSIPSDIPSGKIFKTDTCCSAKAVVFSMLISPFTSQPSHDFTNSNVSSTNSIDVPSDQPSLLPSSVPSDIPSGKISKTDTVV